MSKSQNGTAFSYIIPGRLNKVLRLSLSLSIEQTARLRAWRSK